MAAEDAAVGVQLVDDDVARAARTAGTTWCGGGGSPSGACPGWSPRPGRRRGWPSGSAPACRRRRSRPTTVQPGRARQLAELGHLVLAERLGREEEQRPRRRVVGDGLQDRQGVAQRLARRRRRDHDHVLAAADAARSPPPGGCRAARCRALASPRTIRGSSQSGKSREVGLARGQDGVVDDAAGERRLLEQAGEDGRRSRRGRRCASGDL